jgi:hypothetical protein
MSVKASDALAVLNGICPYFTMFPLSFPLGVLSKRAKPRDAVLDPFCGRGTTNLAARMLGLHSVGIDSSPVAAAIAAAKLVNPSAEEISEAARSILRGPPPTAVPAGEFWAHAFDSKVLREICHFREALMRDCETPERVALRAILLGALHGPQQKASPSYLSNQCPRTYAPKPNYAVRYWQKNQLRAKRVDVEAIIDARANRYYAIRANAKGAVHLLDSRLAPSFQSVAPNGFNWVITSPPYYGMRTYVPDQWLRNWFLGGPGVVDYKIENQLSHKSPDEFSADLKKVWQNAAAASCENATLIVRFGGISDRKADPLKLIKQSIEGSGWRTVTVQHAGNARAGKRQADAFLRDKTRPVAEYDLWARKVA